jgi:hypothetical protein
VSNSRVDTGRMVKAKFEAQIDTGVLGNPALVQKIIYWPLKSTSLEIELRIAHRWLLRRRS